jgi:hypothetical protein
MRLVRVDFGRQVVGPGAVLQLFQRFRIDDGFGDIQLEVQALLEGVGAFDHYVEGLDAVDGDVALGQHLSACVVKIHADKNVEFIGHDVLPSPGWLQRCGRYPRLLRRCSRTWGGCAIAASPRLGMLCDLRNTGSDCFLCLTHWTAQGSKYLPLKTQVLHSADG